MGSQSEIQEIKTLKRAIERQRIKASKLSFIVANEIKSLKGELKRAKGYHESAAKEAKLFGYKSLGQLSKFYGVTAETLQTYHKKDRNRFVDIMKQCEFKLGDNTCQL